jgi:hypothetical protein
MHQGNLQSHIPNIPFQLAFVFDHQQFAVIWWSIASDLELIHYFLKQLEPQELPRLEG